MSIALTESNPKFESEKSENSENTGEAHKIEFLQKRKSVEINEFHRPSLQHISDDEEDEEVKNSEE